MTNYQTLQSSIIDACRESETIQAVILVGSRARNPKSVDDHADLDYLLFASDLSDITSLPGWIESLGTIWLPDFSLTGPGDPEWMVIFEGGLKADFVFLKLRPGQTLQAILPQIPYQGVLARGFQVMLDKTASGGEVSWTPDINETPTHPPQQDFRTANDAFLMAAARAARLIDRRDLWRAKFACDTELKKQLLTLLEWHAHAKNGLQHDTWYDGRNLAEWADPAALAALPETFAAYEAADLKRAFQATLTLYDRLAAETAAALHYPYPTPGQSAALKWLRSL